MATRKGLEPSTSGVTGRRSNQLNYRAIFLSKDSGRCNLSWQGQKDSNPRHSVLETDALPIELLAYIKEINGSLYEPYDDGTKGNTS